MPLNAAQQIPDGRVYAIERNPDGLDLIKENSLRLQADNLTIVSGTAPESLDALPAATHAFIGGVPDTERDSACCYTAETQKFESS